MSRYNEVGKVATKVFQNTENNKLVVRYHDTNVVTVSKDGFITLNTGGWFTNTTKVRMNQASQQFNLGYSVYQKNHDWFVEWNGETTKFSTLAVVLIPGTRNAVNV